MSANEYRSGQTHQFPTVKETITALERKDVEYEDLTDERKVPLFDFMMNLRTAESLGPLGSGLFCIKLFKGLGGNPAAVVGIINDLYARGVEFNQSERVHFVMWLADQETTMDATTFAYIFRRLPAPLTMYFKHGGKPMVLDTNTGLSGNERETA